MNTPPNAILSANQPISPDVLALYHLDGTPADAAGHAGNLKLAGKAAFDENNLSWMKDRKGSALRFKDLGDKATTQIAIPAGTVELSVGAMVYPINIKAITRAMPESFLYMRIGTALSNSPKICIRAE